MKPVERFSFLGLLESREERPSVHSVVEANDAILRHDSANVVDDALRCQRETALSGPVGQTWENLFAQRQQRRGVLPLTLPAASQLREAQSDIAHHFGV